MAIKLYPSFFNDVMAPVMLAGSSSHLAAPQRLGLLTNFLTKGETLTQVEVVMDTDGSFAGTFGLMSEDVGMCSGAIGLAVDASNRNECFEIAEERGIRVKFTKAPMKETEHLNGMKFILTCASGKEFTLVGDSIGGGMIETKKIMGFNYSYKGDTNLIIVVKADSTPTMLDELKSNLVGLMSCDISRSDEHGVAYFFTTTEAPDLALLKSILPDCDVYHLDCILNTPTLPNRKPQLFKDSTKYIELSQEKPMHEVAIDYQIAATGMTREAILERTEYLRGLMVNQVEAKANSPRTDYDHVYGYQTDSYLKLTTGKQFLSGVTLKAIEHFYSVHAMVPNVPNVSFPHGAGGGVVMASLRAAQLEYGFSDDKMIEGLLVAAGYGAIAYTRTTPTGEVIGCAGEHGLSNAFATAALTYIMGGTPEQVDSATSMAMQLSVGHPCDPIAGTNGDPCNARALAACTTPFVYSQLAICNLLTALPFHEVLDAAVDVASRYDDDLLCTGRGGLAACPSACKLKTCVGL